ncbi:MAG TPA: spermidine synthase [Rhodospirillaceae bacterium]|nr:spermidine synthase [Rhodospirillaceae bacterium]HAT36562.1 spermidine synthase [Rhodospirillaceae bacterium]
MSRSFEELAYCETPIGELGLRRRRELRLDTDVFEIKLGEEFLMSSLFTASEIALADLGLGDLRGNELDVVVGGLGLGYTADAVLKHRQVHSLIVIEALAPVIQWHLDAILPLERSLADDPRCRLLEGNFFAMAQSADGFDREKSGRRFDAVLVDIDHTPEFWLAPGSADFYQPDGLTALSRHLVPGGVFGLWSNDLPDDTFTARLASAFDSARAETVTFPNPLTNEDVTQTVYLART